MTTRDEHALIDVYQAGLKVIEYTSGRTYDSFVDDDKTQSAVLHQLLILGEATKRLSAEFRQEHPDIRWSEMAGMRDVLIHAYDTVDLDEVWNTATSDIPKLLVELEELLTS